MHHFPGPNVLNSVEEIPRGMFFAIFSLYFSGIIFLVNFGCLRST